MLKLLFITCNFQKYTERNTYYLSQELSKICDLALWYKPGNINSILKRIPFEPDFILLNDLKETRCPTVTGLKDLKIPYGIIMHDIHYKMDKRKKFIHQNNVKFIFTIYKKAFKKRYSRYSGKVYWLPHFVNIAIFKDYGLEKKIDYLMMGKMADYYPLRVKMYRKMRNKDGFVYHAHPGYRNINESNTKNIFVGEYYAREINRAKMFLTCDSIFHYPLIKYYEVLACKTLLLAPSSQELKALGFIPGVNFVSVNKDNFLKKANYYLHHKEERLRIAQAGYKMVRDKHSCQIRAKQLIDMIHDIVFKNAAITQIGNLKKNTD